MLRKMGYINKKKKKSYSCYYHIVVLFYLSFAHFPVVFPSDIFSNYDAYSDMLKLSVSEMSSTVTSILKVLTYINTSIKAHPIELAVLLAISTYINTNIKGHPIELAVILVISTYIISSIKAHPIELAVILAISTYVISSIKAHPIELAVIQAIMSVSTFKTTVILYLFQITLVL